VGTPWLDTALPRNGATASEFSLTNYGQSENQQGCHDLIVLREIIQRGFAPAEPFMCQFQQSFIYRQDLFKGLHIGLGRYQECGRRLLRTQAPPTKQT
jgi:hypothetical protein